LYVFLVSILSRYIKKFKLKTKPWFKGEIFFLGGVFRKSHKLMYAFVIIKKGENVKTSFNDKEYFDGRQIVTRRERLVMIKYSSLKIFNYLIKMIDQDFGA
jgi:hypothetical protein